MEPSPNGRSAPTAWQPFTFGGVAAFASGASLWLWALLLLTGLFLGWGVISYLETACYPAIEAGIQRLPPAAEIRNGVLRWPTNGVAELANTRLLSLVVNPESAPVPGQAGDVALELTDRALTAQSLFGYWALPYPAHTQVPLGRTELEPLWAAWRPHVRVVLPLGVVLALLLFWIVLATLVAPGLRLLAALLRRDVTLGGCWRLALAALVPAGCGTAFGLLLYASRGFHLLDTLITWLLAHLYALVLWCGAVASLPPRLPRVPFVSEPTPTEATREAAEDPRVTSSTQPRSTQGREAIREAADRPPEPRPVPQRSPFAAPRNEPDPRNPFAGPASRPDTSGTRSLPVSVLARPRRDAPPATPVLADEDPQNPS